MNFDSMMLAAVTNELQDEIIPGRVDRITQPAALEIVLQIYAKGRKSALLISCDAMSARVHLTRAPRANPPAAPGFCMLLRKYLNGAWLEGIEHPFGLGERVLRMTFLGHEGMRCLLYVEIMGKHSNVVLTTKENIILGAIKTITTQISRFREVRPGIKYFGPPRMRSVKRDAFAGDAGINLPAADLNTVDNAQEWLLANFAGLSPLMAREAALRTKEAPLTAESVWFSLNDLLNCARLGEYSPVQYDEPGSVERNAYPIPLLSIPRERQMRWTRFNTAVDDAAEKNAISGSFARERAAILAALRRAHKTSEREIIDADEGIANAQRADEYKQNADLILARIQEIPAGASQATVDDYFASEPSATRTIPLDPKLSASDNAKRYYAKYKKARDSYDRLTQRREELLSIGRTIVWGIEIAEKSESVQELRSLSQEMGAEVARRLRQQSGLQADGAVDKTPEAPAFAGYKIRRYRSVDGWEILVGENATSNDYLTTKIAKSNDIWLHARAIPSAHAIIRSQNRPATVSSAALRLAAEHVARRSDAKHARLTPVDYTLKKYVRKPRGAAPGAVTYSHEKTLDVEPAEDD
ncbi:MAG: NFACT RNA binding domain-containing protein [Capsulimonadaceae bacterium]|nr:NFACT RNA binding domain-containing protein [Capsulimonadaceae bacterium]